MNNPLIRSPRTIPWLCRKINVLTMMGDTQLVGRGVGQNQHAKATTVRNSFSKSMPQNTDTATMAVDYDFLTDWIKDNGPYLYHRLRDQDHLASVLQKGLVPWNHRTDHKKWSNSAYKPRPDHIYLSTWRETFCRKQEVLIQVDLRLLNPEDINPDEDAFWSSGLAGDTVEEDSEEYKVETPNWPDPHTTVRDDDGSAFWDHHYTREQIDTLPYGSYGQWAEAIDLGSDPRHTEFSLKSLGHAAIRGGVPAKAITIVTKDDSKHKSERCRKPVACSLIGEPLDSLIADSGENSVTD